MSRRVFPVMLVLTAIVLTACGSSNGTDSDIVRREIVGQWIRDQESENGGQTWRDRNDDMQLQFNADGTWRNIDKNRLDRAGTYHLNGNRIIVYWPRNQTRYYRIKMLAANNRMEWTEYTSGSFSQTKDYRSRYTRLAR